MLNLYTKPLLEIIDTLRSQTDVLQEHGIVEFIVYDPDIRPLIQNMA